MTDLAKHTWPEVEALLARGCAAILPVGATEAHGPHLPLDTDVTIALGMARRAAESLAAEDRACVVLPPVAYSVADFAAPFAGTLSLPVFRVDETTRERGFLRLRSADGVGIRPTTLANVFQTDLNSLPKPIRGGERAIGFRFPAIPYSVGLRTERIAPLVSLLTRARLEVERRTIKLFTQLHFTVERAGLFSIEIDVPEGVTLTDIGDRKLVDSWRLSEDQRLLTLDLRGRRIGSFTLPIRAVAPLDLAEGALPVPLPEVRDVDREEGTLAVFMDPGIKAVAETEGVIPVEPDKLRREDQFRSELPLAFAWRWRGPGAAVTFEVEARKPKVACDVRYHLVAEEARVKVKAELAFDVEFSGVETFRFRVPKSLVEKNLKVDAKNLREKKHVDDPAEEGKEPTVTYTVTLQGPALGRVLVEARYDEVFPQPLATNQSRPVAIPAFTPLDVERSNAFVALRKSPAIKVAVTGDAYEQIDPAELPKELQSDDTFLALRRFDAPEPFPLELTKHEYQPVADLVVRHTHLKTVVADEERATTLAFFEVLNNDRQFLALKLPEGSDVKELLVKGRPEKPRLGADGVLLVRLDTNLRKDEYYEVDVAYTHPVGTEGGIGRDTRLQGPVLPAYEENAEPFQALLTWQVFYPEEWRITGFDGTARPVEADEGSWLRRAIAALGKLVQPAHAGERNPRAARLDRFADFFPAPTQAHTSKMFVNGTGKGELTISHTTTTARVIFVVLAVVLGAAAVVLLSRGFRPLRAGAALALLALVFLAFSGPGWIPFWNGILASVVATALVVAVVERARATR